MIFKLLRYKSKLPFDLYREVLRSYRHILPELDMQRVQDLVLAAPMRGKVQERLQLEVLQGMGESVRMRVKIIPICGFCCCKQARRGVP